MRIFVIKSSKTESANAQGLEEGGKVEVTLKSYSPAHPSCPLPPSQICWT